jgi:hypothetical protein
VAAERGWEGGAGRGKEEEREVMRLRRVWWAQKICLAHDGPKSEIICQKICLAHDAPEIYRSQSTHFTCMHAYTYWRTCLLTLDDCISYKQITPLFFCFIGSVISYMTESMNSTQRYHFSSPTVSWNSSQRITIVNGVSGSDYHG